VGVRLLDGLVYADGELDTDDAGYGPVSAHLALGGDTALGGRPVAAAAYLRAELPYTRSRLDGSSGGVQLGGAATWALRSRTRLHARVAILAAYTSVSGERDGQLAGLASFDATWRAVSWLGLSAGVDVQTGWYGLGLDHVAARASAHWRVQGPWRVELAGGLPLAGDEPTALAFDVSMRRDLD
jgi:hypothetical protein